MSRMYEFTFVRAGTKPETLTLRAFGNSHRAAERWARRKLRAKKRDPRQFVTVGPARFIPENER